MNWPALKASLEARLDPLGGAGAGRGQSDYDLNPAWRLERARKAAAAVLIALVDRPEGATVLLTRRADGLANHAGQVAFPGGRIDAGETAEQAALREAEEEVGLAPDRVRLVGRSDPYETVTGFAITPVVGIVTPPLALRLCTAEVADAFETPLTVVLDEARYERRFHQRGDDGPRRYFYAVTHEERLIWGATAGMLRAFRARLLDGGSDRLGARGAA